jgi:hypothetical protein
MIVYKTWKLKIFILLHLISWIILQKLEKYNIDLNKITVSGISSGGAMAIQFHISHSKIVYGLASIAGPPYWCANANLFIALTACMVKPELIKVSELWKATEYAYNLYSIDNPTYLSSSKVKLNYKED